MGLPLRLSWGEASFTGFNVQLTRVALMNHEGRSSMDVFPIAWNVIFRFDTISLEKRLSYTISNPFCMHRFPYLPSPSSPTNLSPQSLLTLEAQSRSSYLIKKPRLLGWRGDGIGWGGRAG